MERIQLVGGTESSLARSLHPPSLAPFLPHSLSISTPSLVTSFIPAPYLVRGDVDHLIIYTAEKIVLNELIQLLEPFVHVHGRVDDLAPGFLLGFLHLCWVGPH